MRIILAFNKNKTENALTIQNTKIILAYTKIILAISSISRCRQRGDGQRWQHSLRNSLDTGKIGSSLAKYCYSLARSLL
jgi:hypothetical protein